MLITILLLSLLLMLWLGTAAAKVTPTTVVVLAEAILVAEMTTAEVTERLLATRMLPKATVVTVVQPTALRRGRITLRAPHSVKGSAADATCESGT